MQFTIICTALFAGYIVMPLIGTAFHEVYPLALSTLIHPHHPCSIMRTLPFLVLNKKNTMHCTVVALGGGPFDSHVVN